MSFSLTLSDVPTHVVFWQEKEKDSVLKTLTERIASLEATVASLLKKETPLLSGIEMRRAGLPPLNIAQETDSRSLFKQLIEKSSLASVQPLPLGEPRKPLPGNMYEMTSDSDIKFVDVPVVNLNVTELGDDSGAEDEAEAEGPEEAEVEEAEAEGPEEAEVEVEDAEGEEAEDEDAEGAEQALELTEFEYKGVTYFRDPENQVYQVDADGDLDDSPVGIWNEEKQKVLKYAKTS